ncbi:hypothetical protein [Anaerotruncus massiliensis (ex Liu et al. 2021)]|uniref:hypothetical protein n=1 Tax=Anaerotruncus massiliensis (ex Liu et al. 2021) TaxID=2321404 RepID=UPI003AB5F4D7
MFSANEKQAAIARNLHYFREGMADPPAARPKRPPASRMQLSLDDPHSPIRRAISATSAIKIHFQFTGFRQHFQLENAPF